MDHKGDLPESFDEAGPLASNIALGSLSDLGLKMNIMARSTSTVVEVHLGSNANQNIRVKTSLNNNGTKDIGLAFIDEVKVTADEASETAIMPAMDKVMSDGDKIRRFLDTLKEDGEQSMELHEDLMGQLQRLTKVFTDKARELVEAYNVEVGVQLGKTSDIHKEGRDLLGNKIIYIPKTQWAMLQEKKTNSTKRLGMFAHQKLKIGGQISVKGPDGPAKLLDLAKKSQTFISRDIERKENRAKQEAELRNKADGDAKIAEQLGKAQLIAEFFPFLSEDDAFVCLDCHKGDMQKVQNWLADFEGNVSQIKQAIQVRREIGMGKKQDSKKGDDGSSAEESQCTKPSFTRASSITLPPCLALQIVEMSEENHTVTVQYLRDRNKVPLLSGPKTTFLLEDFLSFKWYFADQEKFYEDIGKRRLHIKYQVEQASGDMIPISLRPLVPFDEYTLNWDNNTRKLNSVKHKQDGKVAFSCSETESHIYDDKPILIYTQVVDDQTLNIVFMQITDTREEIRVDPINITHTSKTVKDFVTEFKKDMGGNALNYRIIVKDGVVQAVLVSTKDGTAQREKFMQLSVPRYGSYVTFSDGKKIGRIHSVPTGMIVTNKNEGAERVQLQYEKRAGPENFGRHVAEIDGYVDVNVILDGDRLTYLSPVKEAWNVSEFKITEEGECKHLEALINEAESKRVKDGDLYEQKIHELSDLLKHDKAKGPEFFATAQGTLAEIRKLTESEDVKKRGLATKQNKALIMSFVRELRLLKLGMK